MKELENRTRRFLMYVALACVFYLTMEGLCYLGIQVLHAKGTEYHPLPSVLSQEQRDTLKTLLEDSGPLSGHHPVLGWSWKPLDQRRTINSQGIRSEHDYSQVAPPVVVRVSAFGDSFTFGSEVEINETWESQLEGQDPRFEVLNFGVGAYGLDQAYLRYLQDGVHFHSDIVVIGF